MGSDRKRLVELRLIVVVLIDLSDPSLAESLAGVGAKPITLTDVVSAEIASNLESVPYVDSAIVSPL